MRLRLRLSALLLITASGCSVGGVFDPDHAATQRVYEKLLCGNNLTVLTPPGKWYIPIWDREEVRIIRETLARGLAVFREALPPA